MDVLLNAVATPRRREILRLLWAHERPAGEIHRALGDVTFGAVSQHLRVLAAAGAISGRRDGRQRLYVARKEALGSLAPWLEAMWDDALYRLKLQAELDEARRGPRPGSASRRPGRRWRPQGARQVSAPSDTRRRSPRAGASGRRAGTRSRNEERS